MLGLLVARCAAESVSGVWQESDRASKKQFKYWEGAAQYSVRNCVLVKFGGSAIAVRNAEASISIQAVTFIDCANWMGGSWDGSFTEPGGGLYANCKNCEVFRCCGYKCEACYGQVLCCVATGVNKAIDVASRSCGRSADDKTQDTFRFMYGDQVMQGFNSSTNQVVSDGAAFESSDSYNLKMLHCSFLNNRGKGSISLYIRDAYREGIHDNNQFVNVYNNSGTDQGVVTFLGEITLTRWVFTGNTKESMLFGKNSWFSGGDDHQPIGDNAKIKAVDCIFDNPDKVSSDQVILDNCVIVSHAVTHVIAHWKTEYCPADFSFSFTPFAEPEKGEHIARAWKFAGFLYAMGL